MTTLSFIFCLFVFYTRTVTSDFPKLKKNILSVSFKKFKKTIHFSQQKGFFFNRKVQDKTWKTTEKAQYLFHKWKRKDMKIHKKRYTIQEITLGEPSEMKDDWKRGRVVLCTIRRDKKSDRLWKATTIVWDKSSCQETRETTLVIIKKYKFCKDGIVLDVCFCLNLTKGNERLM